MSLATIQIRQASGSFSSPFNDGDLRRRVVTFLADRHRPALRQIEVQAEQGIVTLRGRVETFHEKQLSAQVARRVAGVVRLVDEVIVENHSKNSGRKAALSFTSSSASKNFVLHEPRSL